MEHIETMVNDFSLLAVAVKLWILDFCRSLGYASELFPKKTTCGVILCYSNNYIYQYCGLKGGKKYRKCFSMNLTYQIVEKPLKKCRDGTSFSLKLMLNGISKQISYARCIKTIMAKISYILSETFFKFQHSSHLMQVKQSQINITRS